MDVWINAFDAGCVEQVHNWKLLDFGPTKQTVMPIATVPNGQASTTCGRSTYWKISFFFPPPVARARIHVHARRAGGYG